MVNMPRVEQKLAEMNEGIQQTLQIILQNMTSSSLVTSPPPVSTLACKVTAP